MCNVQVSSSTQLFTWSAEQITETKLQGDHIDYIVSQMGKGLLSQGNVLYVIHLLLCLMLSGHLLCQTWSTAQ